MLLPPTMPVSPPLHLAVQRPLIEPQKSIILALLNAGASLHGKDCYGRSPWDCAPQATQDWLLLQISR